MVDFKENIINNYLINDILKLSSKFYCLAKGLAVPNLDQGRGMCGPASLRAVLLFFNVDISEEKLAKMAGSDPDLGTPPEDLVRVAKSLGFNAFTKSGSSLEEINKWINKNIPVIVDWFSVDEGHYSVVKTIKDKKVILMDPEKGKEHSIDLESFKRIWFDFGGKTEQHKNLSDRRIIVVYP